MKFPSIKLIAASIGKTIKRFPFELLFALAGTVAATIKIEIENINRVDENWCLRIMIVANLGLLLSLSATLFAESRKIEGKNKLMLNAIAALIALSLLFLINPGIRQADYVRFFLLSLALHLLVAFSAFISGNNIHGFWQFNKTLFLRFLTSFLYAFVLYLGLSAAIGAMNYLFNFKFEWDTFSILFTWIVGVFTTTFFLAGVPNDFESLNKDSSYPKGLKIFTQYVLIPLATVYVLILLAYEIKILIQWDLPKGAVSYLILSYAVFGILSLLLVYPIRDQEENKWLKTYTRSFYFLLIPLLALLFIAVGVRLADYGVTEFRYFLIMLALWLLFITIYFLFSKKQNIKLIPISLSIVTFISVYGPQSAFSVAMYSQRSILIKILKKNNAYKNDKILPVKKISKADGDRAVEILDYLVKHHDLSSLQPYINVDLTAVSDSLSKERDKWNKSFAIDNYELRNEKLKWMRNYLALNKFSGNGYEMYLDTAASSQSYSLCRDGDILDIKNYNYYIAAKGYSDTTSKMLNGIKFTERKASYSNYSLEVNNEKVTFNLSAFAKQTIASKSKLVKSTNDRTSDNIEKYIVPDNLLLLTSETSHYIITLKINQVDFNQSKKGDINITNADADYLVRIK
jgi:hypothetical protein